MSYFDTISYNFTILSFKYWYSYYLQENVNTISAEFYKMYKGIYFYQVPGV